MFEMIKGTAKGTKIAGTVSHAAKETINWAIIDQGDGETDDTLYVTKTYYCYAMMVVTPTLHGGNKTITFLGAVSVQMKSMLQEWLQKATGLYVLDDYIDELEYEYETWTTDLRNEFEQEMLSDDPETQFNLAKSYASEKVVEDIANYFGITDDDFSSVIRTHCSLIREAAA